MEYGFEETVEKYKGMVFGIAMTRLQNSADSDDVFSEVFLALFRRQPKVENEEHLRAWLIRTTLLCTKKLASGRKKIQNHEASLENSSEVLQIDNSFSLETASQNTVYEAICNLPAKYKDVIFLYYIQGFTANEISQGLGLKGSTVRMRMSRGREMLKEMLKGDFFDGQ